MTGPPALELDGISKRFGPTQALTNVSLTVRKGSLHALLGENGAGKTTLMRIAYGLVRPDVGTIRIGGVPMSLDSPSDAIKHGVGMVHQHFSIVHAMTVAENVALGGRGLFDAHVIAERIESISTATGMRLAPHDRAGSLSLPEQQQLEIIKALAQDARVLILDEPTAVLAPAEAAQLLTRIRALSEGGIAVVLITHKLREALSVADEVTVLRRGITVLSAHTSTLTYQVLADEMLGRGEAPAVNDDPMDLSPDSDLSRSTARRLSREADVKSVVRAHDVSIIDRQGVRRVHAATIDVFPGEIVGIAGVDGAGVRELLRALSGRLPIDHGTIQGPSEVGFVPEDRHREGLALDLSLTENVALRGAGQRSGLFAWREFREQTQRIIDRFDIRTSGPNAPVRVLSGGNQQKLVLARELDPIPSLLIVENPTRGLDIRASASVHARLRQARDAGMAIVLYSSDLDEIMELADRTFAMYNGNLTETVRDRESIGRAMLGSNEVTVPGRA